MEIEMPKILIPISARGMYCKDCHVWVDRREGPGVCKCGKTNREIFEDLPVTPNCQEPYSPYRETGK